MLIILGKLPHLSGPQFLHLLQRTVEGINHILHVKFLAHCKCSKNVAAGVTTINMSNRITRPTVWTVDVLYLTYEKCASTKSQKAISIKIGVSLLVPPHCFNVTLRQQ